MIDFRLANTVGLDTKDQQHSVAIKEALFGIEDPEAFLEFCRDKKNGIEYQTKTERLDTLATKYKKLQTEAKLPHDTAKHFSKNLANKVHQARTFIKNQIELGNKRPFSSLQVDGHKFFTDKEINALAGIGSVSFIIDLSETGELEDSLIQLFLGKFIAKSKYQQLGDGLKRVIKMISGVAK